MELRSKRVLKRGKAHINPSLKNLDSSDEKKVSLSSDKSNSGIKGGSEVEIGVCVDNADEDLEIESLEGRKGCVSKDDKGLFFGSEVLDPVKEVVSCRDGEIEETSVECVHLEEGNKPASIKVSETDNVFKEESDSLQTKPNNELHTSTVVSENGPEKHVESGNFADEITIVSGDDDKQTLTAVLDASPLLYDSEDASCWIGKRRQKKGKSHHGRKKKNANYLKENRSYQVSDTRSKELEGVHGDGGGCGLEVVKHKRGRKRKIPESSECNNGEGRTKKEKVEKSGVHIGRRVLRSRTMSVGGGVEVVDSRLSGTAVGLKRADESTQQADEPKKKLKRRGRPPKVKTEDDTSQPRPKKKLKRRGRPPKVQSETTPSHVKRRGRPPKVKLETMPSHEIVSVPVKSRGRPRKVPGKEMLSQGIQKKRHKNTMFRKLERRGRPPKIEAKTLATHVIEMSTVKLMADKKTNADVKRAPKIVKMRKEEGENEEKGQQGSKILKIKVEDGENEEEVQKLEGNSGHTIAESEVDIGGEGKKGMEKRTRKQLVRDKLVDILLKAGWRIDRRPRQERTYKDCVYIEPSGRSHWSITRAYAKLKEKIEEKDADSNEISAYTPIPEEEMRLLFRYVDKELGYKKKKNRIGKNLNKDLKIMASRKKKKDGLKRKTLWKPAASFSTKSSKVKLKGNKPHCVNGIIESRKPRLLARGSEKGSEQDNDGSSMYIGKRNLLSWMIDSGVILAGSKVQYGKTRRQKRSSEGMITSDGIHCSCCNEIMGISGFVAHVGGKLSQSFDNIYLESGISLRKCLVDSWRKEEDSNMIRFNLVNIKGDDPNDDTCNICGDGGNLICCDGCPSTFHQSCLDIQNFPSGDWNCVYCSCKFCGVVSVNAPHVDDSCDDLTSEMLSCCLCEEKFHRLCLQEAEAVNTDSSRLPFCGRKCQELFERLQMYLGVKLELEDGFSWTLLQRSDVGQDFTVHDANLKVECNSKLAVAFSVMDECFVPIVDERSRTSIIHNVVYNCGSNFRRLDYAGFLTAVLEKGDELVTVASIRIHGYRLAEMPFIGTRHIYRRQGMCRRLLDAIESTLSSIGVEELVIPAIPELLQTWTKAFGFIPIEESKREAMKCMSMVVFPGIDMLRKPLLQNQSSDTNLSPSAASENKAVECDVKPNDVSIPDTIDYKQSPADATGIAKDGIAYEQSEEATVLTAIGVAKDAIDYEQSEDATVVINGSSCLEKGAAGIEKEAIDEQVEEATFVMNGCSGPEADDKCVSPLETRSSNEATGLMDGCTCPQGDVTHLENDKLSTPCGADSLYDLNFPVKNVTCQVPETTGLLIPDDAKSDIPAQRVPFETDVQTSDDSVIAFTESEQLPPTESFPDRAIHSSLSVSMTCGLHQSPEAVLGVKNDDISGVTVSPLASKLIPKNTFDLNLQPSGVDTDMHHVIGDDYLPSGSQVCIKSFEPSDSRSQVKHSVAGITNSKPCDTQPLVLL